MKKNIIYGSIIGTAMGDSIGLPYEGLSKAKISKKNLTFEKQNLIFNRGMFSDDTEHTIMVAQSLIESYDNEELFEKLLKKRLKLWLLGLPAGVGFATMRAIFKSFFIQNSGVFSAGNAPAMRSALLGIVFGDDNEKLQRFVKINTIVTHTDPKAYYGALAVAKASYLASIMQENQFFDEMRGLIVDKEFLEILDSVENNLDIPTIDFAKSLGLEDGVSGYIYNTIPIVLHSWLRNRDDLKSSIIDVVICGGDSDTTGAIVGSIVGARSGNIPTQWINGVIDYPRNIKFIKRVSDKLELVSLSQQVSKAPFLSPITILLRNMVFLIIVLIVAIIR